MPSREKFTGCQRWTLMIVCAVLLLCGWIALFFLFFAEDFLINEHYSARTVHLHKVTKNAHFPIAWNSLGSVTPYVERQMQDSTWEPSTYFLHRGVNEHRSYSALEDPFGYTMYINSERSVSILSNICPSIYVSTLIVICDISLAYFFVALVSKHKTKDEKVFGCSLNLVFLRDLWVSVTLFVYGACLFAIFAAGALLKRAKWDSVTVEYMISPQVSSVVYNIVVLAMYGLYLRRKQSYWELLVGSDTADAEAEKQKLVELGPQPEEDPKPWMQSPNGMNAKFGANVYGIQLQSMYNQQHAWNMMPAQKMMPGQKIMPAQFVMPGQKQHLLMSTSGIVTKRKSANQANAQNDEEDNGPVTNELNPVWNGPKAIWSKVIPGSRLLVDNRGSPQNSSTVGPRDQFSFLHARDNQIKLSTFAFVAFRG
jgi:hypothetical protein